MRINTTYNSNDLELSMRSGGTLFHLKISSWVMTSVSIFLWLVTWVKGRKGSPFRYAPLLVFFSSSLISQVLERMPEEDEFRDYRARNKFIKQSFFLNVMQDINLCSLLSYVLLCLFCLMKRTATNVEVAACLFVCAVPALLFEAFMHFLGFREAVFIDPPYAIGLMLVTMAALHVVLKSFFPRGPVSRDHKYIRVSSLGLAFVVLDRCVEFMVINFVVFRVVGVSNWISYLLTMRGLLFSICLCYLDLEVWSLLPCVNMKGEHHAYIFGRVTGDKRPTKILTVIQAPFYESAQSLEQENEPQPNQTTSFEGATFETFPEKQ